jgi:hypothetical protein
MKSFSQLLKEAAEKEELPPEEEEVVEPSEDEELPPEEEEVPEEEPEDELPPEEDEEPTEEVEAGLVSDVRDLIDSVLDALEADMLAAGETVQEGESIDLGLELLSKFADQIPEEILQQMFDEISSYYEMEVEDGEELPEDEEPVEDEEEFFEEPAPDEEVPEEEEVKVESVKPRVLNRKSLKELQKSK